MNYESQKSYFCAALDCVEVVRFDGKVAVFDSDLNGHGGAVVVSESDFDVFEEGVRLSGLSETSIFPDQGAGFTSEDIEKWRLGLEAGEFAARSEMQLEVL